MNFINQAKNERANVGTYLLTFSLVLVGMVTGQFVAEGLAVEFLGFSFLNIPHDVDQNGLLILLLLPFIFALIALLLSLKFIHKRTLLSVFTTRETFDFKRVFLSFGIWMLVMGVSLVATIYSSAQLEWNFKSDLFLRLLLIGIFVLPLQTLAEDLFFRSFLLQGLGRLNLAPIIAVVVTGLIFGLLHVGNPEIAAIGYELLVFYIVTGIFLGILTHLDDGMELGIGYHFANNFFAAVVVTNNWQAFQTDALYIDYSKPTFGWEAWLTILLIQPILLFFFARLYQWKWKRLFKI